MEQWERLLDDLKREFVLRERELALLHEIDLRILDRGRPLEDTFSFIVEQTQDLLQSDHTQILLKRGRCLESVYTSSQTDLGQLLQISGSITGECLTSGSTIRIDEIATSSYRDKYVSIYGQSEAMGSLLACPIKIGESVIGVLNTESSRVRAFDIVHEKISRAIAAQLAIALQQSQFFDQAALFSEVDQLLFADDSSRENVLELALKKVSAALHRLEYIKPSVAQILFPRGRDELEIVYSTNPAEVGVSVSIEKSISGRAARERRTIVVGDVSKDPEYRTLSPLMKSEIAVPILLGDDDVFIGVLNVESEELDVFSGFYELILTTFADKVKTLLAFTKLRSDVTEALEMRQADEVLLAIGDQTSNMVHRLNNTVGAMRVHIRELQAMHEEGELRGDDELTTTLDSLLRLADRTLEMPQEVTRLLNTEGRLGNFNEYVESALRVVDPPSNIELILNLDRNLPPLPLYCFDIVVQNLLQNAVDAMSDGGQLTVTTSVTSYPGFPGGYVELIVSDNGVGIPDRLKRRLFTLNFTTKRDKEGQGLGLGLWWVRNFVRRARGEISIVSEEHVGTVVTIKIPVGSNP